MYKAKLANTVKNVALSDLKENDVLDVNFAKDLNESSDVIASLFNYDNVYAIYKTSSSYMMLHVSDSEVSRNDDYKSLHEAYDAMSQAFKVNTEDENDQEQF